MLRCPTCLSLLLDPDVKRCPACRSKIRRRSRPTVVVEHSGIADRPLPLVERELQARIEAETAARFRHRRRAAKVARRIASLPPTVFDGDAIRAVTEILIPRPTDASSTIIDLPADAVRDVASGASMAVLASARDVVEPVVVERVLVEPVVVEPVVVEKVVVEPEVVELVEPDVVEPAVVEPEVVELVEPEVVELVEPEVVEPAVVEPEVIELVEQVDPVGTPVVEPAPVAATSWQRSNSVWTNRVFNTAPRLNASETVEWPPRWKPAAPLIDLSDESKADEIDYAAPAD